jgi:hypothetical protein
VGNDPFAVIDDAKLSGPSARFIERMLIAAIDANLPERNTGEFLELPAHAPPVDRAHDDDEVGAGLVVKQLREYLLRAAEAFGLAALPMHGRIRIIEPLNAVLRECPDLDRFAYGLASRGLRGAYEV